jgi:L-erythro-3,5-diaminohexanoate dehydrogenase
MVTQNSLDVEESGGRFRNKNLFLAGLLARFTQSLACRDSQPGRLTVRKDGHMAPPEDLARELGLYRVTNPEERAKGVLPQAASRLDASPSLARGEVRIRVDRLNLDAASYRQLSESNNGDGEAIRDAVRDIIAARGKMHNAVTGSGGMLTGIVDEVGPDSPLGLRLGDRIATLVSLTLTPLVIHDRLAHWDGLSEQITCDAHAILFARSIAAVIPDDLPIPVVLSVMDVCGAPAFTKRVVEQQKASVVAILGAGGKSGSLSAAAAREAGASRIIGVVPTKEEAEWLRSAACLVDEIVVADARKSVPLGEAVTKAGGPADVTVVCVNVPGCEGGAILSTKQHGTIIFFSMATSFSSAALGAEGMAADVSMLIGNGYVTGHAAYALALIRRNKAVRTLFARRVGDDPAEQKNVLRDGGTTR